MFFYGGLEFSRPPTKNFQLHRYHAHLPRRRPISHHNVYRFSWYSIYSEDPLLWKKGNFVIYNFIYQISFAVPRNRPTPVPKEEANVGEEVSDGTGRRDTKEICTRCGEIRKGTRTTATAEDRGGSAVHRVESV